MKHFRLVFLFMSSLSAQSQTGREEMLDAVFAEYFRGDEPGGAVLLAQDGKIIYQKGFGIADVQTKEPVTVHTLFNTGSISKTFIAYGILRLAEQGKLSLDDELDKYFPDFDKKEIARKVKLYHLLTHTSGIPDSRKVSEQREFYLTAKDEENFAPLKKTESLLFEPGTRYQYSNPAFNGLALIIEKVSGQKWQHYIAETIFRPSGMNASTITDGPHPQSGVAHAYILNEQKEFEELDYGEEPTFAAAGNGGVWSSVSELWKYEQAIQKHLFLSPQGINRSRTVFPFAGWTDSLPQRLGLSWFITKDNGTDLTGHTGSQGGFISDYCWWPGKKLFYVLLCNITKPTREIRNRVFEIAGKNF